MSAPTVTLKIIVMGLAALSASQGGGLEILLPNDPLSADHRHQPVVVFPSEDSAYRQQAWTVWYALNLPPSNYDDYSGLLVFHEKTFGAVLLDHAQIVFDPPLPSSSAKPNPKPYGRHHGWMANMWFAMTGEVPTAVADGKDPSWLVSLADVSSCAKGGFKSGSDLLKSPYLSAYFSSTSQVLGPLEVVSLGSMIEKEHDFCDKCSSEAFDEYVPTLRFGPGLWPFEGPNQATADTVAFSVEIPRDQVPKLKVKVKGPNGQEIGSYKPYWDGGCEIDILIGNLMPLGSRIVCNKQGLEHIMLYSQLLQDPSCDLRVPRLGWLRTRKAKSLLHQTGDDVSPIIRVVSEPSSGGGSGGSARSLCFQVTN